MLMLLPFIKVKEVNFLMLFYQYLEIIIKCYIINLFIQGYQERKKAW